MMLMQEGGESQPEQGLLQRSYNRNQESIIPWFGPLRWF